MLAPELTRLSELVVQAAWARPAYRDLTRRGLRQALEELLDPVRRLPRLRPAGATSPGRGAREVVSRATQRAISALSRAHRRHRGRRRSGAQRAGRAGGSVPADLRTGHGQGRRGHRLLSLRPAARAQRGGRRSGRLRRLPRGLPRDGRGHPCPATAHDDDPVDPRHETIRGRAGQARPALGRRDALGSGGHPTAALAQKIRRARPGPIRPRSTSRCRP